MRVDIDHQDIAELFEETERRRGAARKSLAFSLGSLAVCAAAAVFFGWRAINAIAASNASTPASGILSAMRGAPGPFMDLGACAAIIVLAISLAVAILRQRRKEAAIRRDEFLQNALMTGRFEYIFAPEMLVIKSAHSVRKICWANFSAMENNRRNIIFRRKDGAFEFIPKNVFPNSQFGDSLLVKHEKSVDKTCPLELANSATPLSVTFESTPADYADYEELRLRRREGRLHFLRRVYNWRLWPAYLFLAFSALALLLAVSAFAHSQLVNAGMAAAFFAAAIFVFHRNSQLFRGADFPFRKDAAWPYAQSDLVSVQLTREGVRRQRHGAGELIGWSAIGGYVESRRFGYLVIAPGDAIALPKRAFVSAAHFNDFRLRAKACIAGARNEQAARKRQRIVGSIGGGAKAPGAKAEKTAVVAKSRPAKKRAASNSQARAVKTGAA